jgi:hypothetical protein
MKWAKMLIRKVLSNMLYFTQMVWQTLDNQKLIDIIGFADLVSKANQLTMEISTMNTNETADNIVTTQQKP